MNASLRRAHSARALVALAASLALLAAPTPAYAQQTQQKEASTSTVLISLAINAGIAAAQIVVFVILRRKFRKVYAPKTFLGPPEERSEPLPDTLLGWTPQWLKTPALNILENQGMDAYMFLEFLSMMAWIFLPIFALTWVLLLPIYGANTTGMGDGFQRLIFGKIGTGQQETKRFVAPLLVHYLINGWILYQVKTRLDRFLRLRHQWLKDPKHAATAQARTLLVTGIPNDMITEKKMIELYSPMPGGVERVWLHRELRDLPDLHDERLKYLNKLESAETSLIKTAFKKIKKGKVDDAGANADAEMSLDVADRYVTKKERPTAKKGAKLGCFGGEKVDAIEFYREEIERLTREIEERRTALTSDPKYRAVNSAFILFRTQLGCYTARNATAHHAPYRMADRYVEAHPKDVVWANLTMNPYEKRVRNFIGWAITIAIVVFWTIITGFIGIVSNVQGLCSKVSWLAWLCKIPGPVVGIIQGFLPTILLAVAMALLPIVLRLLARLSGHPTRRSIELSLSDRMFIFQVIQNYLLLTIISGVSSSIQPFANALTGNITYLPTLLSQNVPKANTFFITYITLQGLAGLAAGFLQIAPLVIYYLKKFVLASTPRAVWHNENDMGSVAWGTLWPFQMLIVVISIGYMILAPIINGFAFAFFVLYYCLYKYLFLFVYDIKPETETGGLFFPKAINQMFVGLYVEMVIVTVLFFTAQYTNADGSTSQAAIPQGVFMIILIVITIGFQYLVMNAKGDLDTALPLTVAPAYSARFGGDAAIESGSSSNGNGNGSGNGASHPEDVYGKHAAEKASQDEGNDVDTFLHPAVREEQRELWFPNDRLGMGSAAVRAAKKHGFTATNRDTGFDEKDRIVTTADVPPGETLD